MHHRFFVVFLVSSVLSLFITFAVPVYNVARNPIYIARFAYVYNGQAWLVDQRFGSTTYVLATESTIRLGVIEVPSPKCPYRDPISKNDSDLVIIQQEIGWPIASMFWRARYSDLPRMDSSDPMPTELAIGSRGFGEAFAIITPASRVSYYLRSAYWPGSISYGFIFLNVAIVASVMTVCWALILFVWKHGRAIAIAQRCSHCGYYIDQKMRSGFCPECGRKPR